MRIFLRVYFGKELVQSQRLPMKKKGTLYVASGAEKQLFYRKEWDLEFVCLDGHVLEQPRMLQNCLATAGRSMALMIDEFCNSHTLILLIRSS